MGGKEVGLSIYEAVFYFKIVTRDTCTLNKNKLKGDLTTTITTNTLKSVIHKCFVYQY